MRVNILLALIFVIIINSGCNGTDKKTGTWSVYKADAASTSYSGLKQINRENVKQLQVAWTYAMNDAVDTSRIGRSECNPIIIDGIMYATSARHRVYAINAATGKEAWSFDPFNGGEGGGVNRGVTYWEEGKDKRILFTAGDHLFAVEAATGKPIMTFGDSGKISMNIGFRGDPSKISVIPTSPGIVYKDLLIMGTEVSELYGAEPGYIQCYDIRTGKLVWTFHTIPLPGEAGYETWPEDAYKYAGGANAWAGLSLDEKRGMVFLSLGSPTYDFYGADRKGMNLYGNCVLALDAETGKHKWHFQTVHHDLWDYDLPAPPNLVTVVKDGKKVDAVAQVSKVGFVYVLNRETGESLFPIEERKVPVSYVPGEEAWPTQPFPLKPKPFARQMMTEDDLADFTPGAHDSLVKRFRSLRYEGLFTPPDLKSTLNLPGTRGGAEWGGAAWNQEEAVLYVRSNDSPEIDSLQKVTHDANAKDKHASVQGKAFYTTYCVSCHGADRNGDEPNIPSLVGLDKKMTKDAVLDKIKKGGGKMPAFASVVKDQEENIIAYLFQLRERRSRAESDLAEVARNMAAQKGVRDSITKADSVVTYLDLTAYSHFRGPDGISAIKPPWGTLSAINLNNGDYVWQVPAGNHPELQKKGEPYTGTEGSPGPMVTAGGLVFLSGTSDKKFTAYNKENGQIIWDFTLPAAGSSTPCSYSVNGKQYIAISVGGDKKNAGGYIMAFALPE
ncbi:MAG: PQQ-binding-like beta-propeller repeat protein [Chitinophagaceae bacterium]